MKAHLPILLVLAASVAAAAEPASGARPAPDKNPAQAQKLLDALDQAAAAQAPSLADRKVRSAQYYAVGKRLYENRLYPEARQQLEMAVQLDPANEEAKGLLQLTEAVLSVRRSRYQVALQQLVERDKVEAQEQLDELQNHVDRARVLYAGAVPGKELVRDGDALSAQLQQLEEADRQLARAREIVKWMNARVPTKDFDLAIENLQDHVFKESRRREATLQEMGRAVAADQAVRQREREEEARKRQIRMLMDKAKMLYDRRDYDEAGRLCRRVKELDPTNTAAVEMEVACRRNSITKRSEVAADKRKEALLDWVELSGEGMVPHSNLLVYPRDWAEISRRESLEEKRLQEPEWQRDIRAALQKEVSLEFVDQPLDECIKYLQGLTDATIIVDPAAFAAGGASAKQAITMRLSKTRLDLALKWILKMAKLDYTFKNGAIYISTPDKLGGELVQKVYQVKDLTNPIPNFPGPQLNLGGGAVGMSSGAGGGAAGAGAAISSTPEANIVAPGTLMDMIKRVIQPTIWGQNGVSIEEKDGQLTVFCPQEVHAQISQLLENFRKSQTLQVYVEAKYLDVTQGFLEEIGIDWGGNPSVGGWTLGQTFDAAHPSAPSGDVGAFDVKPQAAGQTTSNSLRGASWAGHRGTGSDLDNGLRNAGVGEGLSALWSYFGHWRMEALLRAVSKEEHGSVLFAPRLTMFNNQRAHILVGRQQSYISGYTGTGTVYTPTVASAIMDGVTLDVRPIVSYDRRYITLELRPTLIRPVSTTATNSINTAVSTGGGATPTGVNLQYTLPALEIRTIRTTATVPDGGTVMLSGMMKELQDTQRGGIPFLMDLPVLGRLFSNDYKDVSRRNLLILVTARLILFSEEEQKL